jgi:uncharacterized phage-associated protein
MLTAKQVADCLVTMAHRVGDPITHLKLQKLCYYVQGFSLALRDQRMFPERIEAWKHGPVVSDLFHEYKMTGNSIIPPPKDFAVLSIPAEDRRIIRQVYDVYGQFSPWRLRQLTHNEPPWKDVYQEGVQNIPISPNAMKAYFKTQIKA